MAERKSHAQATFVGCGSYSNTLIARMESCTQTSGIDAITRRSNSIVGSEVDCLAGGSVLRDARVGLRAPPEGRTGRLHHATTLAPACGVGPCRRVAVGRFGCVLCSLGPAGRRRVNQHPWPHNETPCDGALRLDDASNSQCMLIDAEPGKRLDDPSTLLLLGSIRRWAGQLAMLFTSGHRPCRGDGACFLLMLVISLYRSS